MFADNAAAAQSQDDDTEKTQDEKHDHNDAAEARVVPFSAHTSAPKKNPVAYNSKDILYMLSVLVVSNTILKDVSAYSKPKLKGNWTTAFMNSFFPPKLPKNEPQYSYYHQGALLDAFRDTMRETGAQAITAADILQAALAHHKKNDPSFNRMPSGVTIAGCDVHAHICRAAECGIVINDTLKDQITPPDHFKANKKDALGKKEQGVLQGQRYVEAMRLLCEKIAPGDTSAPNAISETPQP